MSDHSLNQTHPYLNALNAKIEKLGRKVDELDILAYRYKRLSHEIDQIDRMAFEIRQSFDKVQETCKRIINKP
jgi:predicted transcriptional regulator